MDPVLLLFLQVGLILALSRIVGSLFTRIKQPQVMGEMVAGILLGPSFFGWIAPQWQHFVFPSAAGVEMKTLYLLSQVGIIFFLFLIGLEFDPTHVRDRGKTAMAVTISSIAAPFALGALLTVGLYRYTNVFGDPGGAHFFGSVLFMGAALSVTAFPVLARILTERNLHRTRIGTLAITCAAAKDAVSWGILAVVVAAAHSPSAMQALKIAGAAGLFIVVMFMVVKPFLSQLEVVYDRQGQLSQNVVAGIFLLILFCSFMTELIGLHAMFGAFLLGCIMPKGSQFVRHLSEKLEDYTVVFLLPIFFAYTGLKTEIRLINSPELMFLAALVIGAACIGMYGGATLAARFTGLKWRESSAIGILMNTRGLMELVILSIGLQLGVISPSMYTIMVIMALATTLMTTPLLHWFYSPGLLTPPPRSAKGATGKEGFGILIPVALPKSGGPLVQLADTLISDDMVQGRLYALHLRRPADHEAYRSGLDEANETHDEALAPLLAQARGRGIRVEPISFISRDVPADIAAVAAGKSVALVLMGFHKPIIGKTILGGTVHRVLTHCETDVAIFVDRGFRQARRILVPYLGSAHDRLALELAGRMARNTDASVTVLHVVPPLRGDASRTLGARSAVDAVFHDPTQPAPVTFRVVADPSPVGVVLHQAQDFDLVVIGVAEEWGLESHLFGWRPERIARDCPCSLLVVRKYAKGPGAAGIGLQVETSEGTGHVQDLVAAEVPRQTPAP